MAGTMPTPPVNSMVTAMPDNPRMEPTDRSMPAEMITIICPTAMIATTDICRPMANRLSTLRK
ncbi:MAG: hypothetical protein BWY83_01734 [bacterium ADurb.Bin478]|nr:MAG: hypothetical protein BWY83_01734 [bacterium ADurb.Bin478]